MKFDLIYPCRFELHYHGYLHIIEKDDGKGCPIHGKNCSRKR